MYRPGLEQLPSYQVGEEPVWTSKLDANERSAALPQAVRNEISRRMRQVQAHRYPELDAKGLRTLLAAGFGLSVGQVNVGNGSSELIGAVCSALGGVGRPIAFQWPSFSMYPIYAAIAGSPAVAIPLDEQYRVSVDVVLQKVKQSGAKLLILCNPNNPTGGVIPAADLRRILQEVACPVLVDEAYHEYCGETCLSWLAEYPNLMLARTFSKAYGLASARIGYLLASPEISQSIGKLMLPYHINSYSLAAAEVCFSMREILMQEVRRTMQRRDRLFRQLKKFDFVQVFPSATNFLLIKVAKPEVLDKIFIRAGIGIRNFSQAPGLEGCLRITVGTAHESQSILACVQQYGEMSAVGVIE